MYNYVLNKDKSIGKVVFIVEGDKKEHTLLGYIFKEILDYSVVDVKRNCSPYTKYVSKHNPNSRIFVVSANTSNLKSAGEDGKEYLDRVFMSLYDKYALDITNAAVYYIFDRDNESNLYTDAEKLVNTLKNSRDNGIELNGLLLMSYPCIEAYIKSCVDDCSCEIIKSPKALKQAINEAKYQYQKIANNEIIRSCENMLLGINKLCGRDLTEKDLDDFSEIGSKVLFEEHQLYLSKKEYMILSLLSVAFIDLGIVETSKIYSNLENN